MLQYLLQYCTSPSLTAVMVNNPMFAPKSKRNKKKLQIYFKNEKVVSFSKCCSLLIITGAVLG